MRIAIVGSGLTGATLAHLLGKSYDVDVFEKRTHLGGNCYTERDPLTGVMEHRFGPHIFHTAHKHIWDFVNGFAKFELFDLRVKSMHSGEVYSGPPINLHTINQFYKTNFTPAEAKMRAQEDVPHLASFEFVSRSLVGERLYRAFLEGYTRKQWGISPSHLPGHIALRLGHRYDYNDRRHPASEYQGIPRDGYTDMIRRMFGHVPVHLNRMFTREDATTWDHVFFTGPLDEYFGYQFGALGWRTLTFKREVHKGDYQGCPIMCYPDSFVEWTRITEHKHFAPWEQHDDTVIYKEFSSDWAPGQVPFYPTNFASDQKRLSQYQALESGEKRVTFVGRLGKYKYIDMDQAIRDAMDAAGPFL